MQDNPAGEAPVTLSDCLKLVASAMINADHLAVCGEHLQGAVNGLHEAEQAVDLAADDAAEALANEKLDQARELMIEHWRAARDATHEYRKRAERARKAMQAVNLPQPQQAAPAVEDLLVMAVECGVIRMSQVMSADLQDALVAFAKRLAAAPPQQAPAPQPVGLTQAQRIRLWNNSPQLHGDVVGRDAFERLVKFIEEVHRIGIPAPQATKQK